MALVECPECGKKISDKSEECVHCGFPIGECDFPTVVKRKCEYCGRVNEGYDKNCIGCGAPLEDIKVYQQKKPNKKIEIKENPDRRYCPECGKIIPVFEERCPSCLKMEQKKAYEEMLKQEETRMPENVGLERNKWVALLLCVFFGYFGVHKFYERKIGMGIVYFLTMGLFGFGWFADIIILLFKPNPYYLAPNYRK